MKKILIEAIGTFFLVLAVLTTANPLAIGLTLAAMVYSAGHISGGHFNPAVSLAVWLRGKLSTLQLAYYMGAQMVGAFLAAWFAFLLLNKIVYPAPAIALSPWMAMAMECLGTFLLCLVVLTVATTNKLHNNYIYGFAIGLTLTAVAYIGGPHSGGAFNPAIGTGPLLFDLIKGGPAIKTVYLYLIGPFCGSLLATAVYRIINEEEFQK